MNSYEEYFAKKNVCVEFYPIFWEILLKILKIIANWEKFLKICKQIIVKFLPRILLNFFKIFNFIVEMFYFIIFAIYNNIN